MKIDVVGSYLELNKFLKPRRMKIVPSDVDDVLEVSIEGMPR